MAVDGEQAALARGTPLSLLTDLAEATVDIVYALRLEPDVAFEFISESILRHSGYSAAEVVADPGLLLDAVDPRDRPALGAALRAPVGSDIDVELRWVHRDGSTVCTAHHARKRARDDGSVVVVGVGRELRTVEERLSESERRFRLLAENASDVVYLLRPDGTLVWVSPSVHETLGWGADELTGTAPWELVHPDDVEQAAATFADAVGTGIPATPTRVRLRHRDGSYRDMSATARAVDDGGVGGFVVALRDTTDQVAVERSLVASESLLRRVVDTLLDPWVRLEAVRDEAGHIVDFRYIDANDAACRANRTTRESLIGRRLLELLPDHAVRGYLASYAEVVDTGVPWVADDLAIASPFDGAERRFDNRAVRFGDGVSITWRDVTDRHHAARRLSESEQRYRLLAENASDVVIEHDLAGRMEWVAPSAHDVLSWTPEELTGRSIGEFIHPDDLRALLPRQRQAMASGATNGRAELRFAIPGGGWRWVSVAARVLRDTDGTPTGAVESLRDIQAEVEARQALARSEQRFRLAMTSAPTGMAVVSLDRRFIEVNPALCRIVGRDDSWLLDHGIPDIIDPDDDGGDLSLRAEVLRGNASTSGELRLRRADGSVAWVEQSIGVLYHEDGTPLSYVSQFIDVTEARRSRERLRFLATHDPLTDLVNRTELLAQLEMASARRQRSGSRTAVLFCDLDGLKAINDTHGHALGDLVIVESATRIAAQVRSDDIVARLGGDEFVVVIPRVQRVSDAEAIAAKIHDAVAQPMVFDGIRVALTVSIGVVVAEPGLAPHVALERADMALYRAKTNGRARTVIFDPTIDSPPTQ